MLISDVIDVQTDRSRETDVRVETETSMTVGDTRTDRQVFSDSAESSDETFRFKQLSFLHWDVNGLLTKLKDREPIQYISSFHFVCLVETFVDYLEPSVFSSHTVFCKPAVKLTKQGRKSGGVLCLIKNELVPYVTEIKCDRGHSQSVTIRRLIQTMEFLYLKKV